MFFSNMGTCVLSLLFHKKVQIVFAAVGDGLAYTRLRRAQYLREYP